MRKNGPIALIFHTLVIVVLVAFTPDETLTLPTHGLSLRWFRAILNYPDFISAFFNSLKLAFASATLSLIVALPAALAIGRARFPGRGFLNGLLLSPLVIPGLVLGIALLRFFALNFIDWNTIDRFTVEWNHGKRSFSHGFTAYSQGYSVLRSTEWFIFAPATIFHSTEFFENLYR